MGLGKKHPPEDHHPLGQLFENRSHAGKILAQNLLQYANRSDVVVYALPRGGVPVAWEVARVLGAPLDVLIVRKVGAPGNEELAMGAIAPDGICVFNQLVIADAGVTKEQFDECERRERRELRRRETLYRGDAPYGDLDGKTAILVDDGLATGATMRAAVRWASARKAERIVVAAPVAAADTCRQLEREERHQSCICSIVPDSFQAVGLWYRDFHQVTDEEVVEILRNAD